MGTTTYTVIVSYQQDMEYVELAESADRAAIHVFAALIASQATPEICAVWVVDDDANSEQVYCGCGERHRCLQPDRTP